MYVSDDWPRDGEDLVEKVISINYDPVRKPMIALTGYNDILRWQIATVGMKEGDLITTTWKIPKIPVKPIVGNSYPLGALPTGTQVCLVQKFHDVVAKVCQDLYFYNENTSGTLIRKVSLIIFNPIVFTIKIRFWKVQKKTYCICILTPSITITIYCNLLPSI